MPIVVGTQSICKVKRTLIFFFILYLNIVHRIGRTGRSGKTGLATTFINKANDESVLLDLKHLLIEARQKVPLFLAELESENERYLQLGGINYYFVTFIQYLSLECIFKLFFISDERGCTYCAGLGHRITDCPKLEAVQTKQASNIGRRDYLANNAADY